MCERRPFFSIITVCFNAGDALPLAVRGLREQSCGDYEHIIKDGGSTDGSVERVRSLVDGDGRTKVISCPDGGIYDAMNAALSLLRGRYVYFLNCGDGFADPEVLADIKRFIEGRITNGTVNPKDSSENGAHGAFGCKNINDTVNPQNMENVGVGVASDGDAADFRSNTSDDAVIYGDFMLRGERIRQPRIVDGFYLYRRPLNHQSAFFGRGVFDKLGGFDVAFAVRADHEFTVRAYKSGTEFVRLDRVINVYEGGGFSERDDKKELRKTELAAIRERHFSAVERKKYDRRIRLSMSGLRRRIRSARSPKWLRSIYRKVANFFNR